MTYYDKKSNTCITSKEKTSIFTNYTPTSPKDLIIAIHNNINNKISSWYNSREKTIPYFYNKDLLVLDLLDCYTNSTNKLPIEMFSTTPVLSRCIVKFNILESFRFPPIQFMDIFGDSAWTKPFSRSKTNKPVEAIISEFSIQIHNGLMI